MYEIMNVGNSHQFRCGISHTCLKIEMLFRGFGTDNRAARDETDGNGKQRKEKEERKKNAHIIER